VARVLVTAWPLLGHVYPCLAVARELRRRGHEVAFYSGKRVRALLDREGFTLIPFGSIGELAYERTFLSPDRANDVRRPFAFMALLQRWLADSLDAQALDIDAAIRGWRPDLLVSEEAMWAPSVITQEKHGIPVVVCSVMAGSLLPGRDLPFPGVGLGRPQTMAGRAVHVALRAGADLLARPMRRQVNDVRRAHGLRPLTTSIREAVGNVPLYLVRGCPEFDYDRRDLRDSVEYAGPLDAADDGDPPPEWLKDLPRDQPLIYVSEGTATLRPLLLKAAVRALAGLDMHMIVATGRERDPETVDLGERPRNLTVKQWVPQRHMFARTAVVVTVGGCGTILGALSAGVPVLAVPAEMDQPDNARRVVDAGAGLAIPRHRCTPARLRAAVLRLLRDPSYRYRARLLAARLAAYGGAARAVDLIELKVLDGFPGVRHEITPGVDTEKVLW